MSVELLNPSHHRKTTVRVHGSDVKQWLDAGWVKVGKASPKPPTDPEQNAPSSPAPLAEQEESDDS